MQIQTTRRPLKSRTQDWAQRMAAACFYLGLKPNHVSVMSMVFALLAVICLIFGSSGVLASKPLFYLLAGLCIQLRLLCNLIDGLLAVEWKLQSKYGELFNELPDRCSDFVILMGLGVVLSPFSSWAYSLGWLAASLALLTAYIRNFGSSIGTKAYFNGPMAKPQRMFVITCGSLGAALLSSYGLDQVILMAALCVVVLGSIVTCISRLNKIVEEIKHVG